ncbi:MAG: DnaD domain protein [Oscillospiraceae bacterium]|nr:DnaD domain protein [Oscillospiraceae bacterium]
MAYKLNEHSGDCLAVPQLIVAKLPELEDDWLRVALYVLSTGCTEPAQIAQALRLASPKRAKEALTYWKGAGLLCDDRAALPAGACLDGASMPTACAPRLTTREITKAAQTDGNIASLVQECQALLGAVLTENDTSEIVSLYLSDELPPDMILLGVAHYAALGKRSGKYIARALRSWQAQGIDTGAAAERYLHSLEQRERNEVLVAELFGLQAAKFTRAESTLIAEWFEGFGYASEMISEALGYAGEHRTVRYVNGILRAWYAKGFKTAKDVQAESATGMANVQPMGKAPKRDILQNARGTVPVYKPRKS